MVLARASQSVITFADAIQVSHLGPKAIAATATGGLNVFGFVVLPMGMVFIVQSFVAQLVGRGEGASARRYAWYGLGLALAAAIVAVLMIPAITPLLSLAGYSDVVRAQMAEYMWIRILSVGAIVGVEALGAYYGGLGNTWMQMLAGVVTMVVAIACNWLLIDGHLGAPAMGVAGAALASVIASWAGFAVVVVALWRGWGTRGAARGTVGSLGLSWRELRRVVRFGLPNGLNWFLEFFAFQLFVNGVLASLGDESVAALNVVIAVNSIAFMPAFGLASAGAILAGQAIGAGARELVGAQVRATLTCTLVWMAVIGGSYLIAPRAILGLFAEGEGADRLIALGTTMLQVSAAWQVFDATSMTLAETLRAAGDTTWTAIVRMILAWAVFMPSAFAVVHFGGGAVGAMLCLAAYVALLAVALVIRFRSGAWRSIQLIEPQLLD